MSKNPNTPQTAGGGAFEAQNPESEPVTVEFTTSAPIGSVAYNKALEAARRRLARNARNNSAAKAAAVERARSDAKQLAEESTPQQAPATPESTAQEPALTSLPSSHVSGDGSGAAKASKHRKHSKLPLVFRKAQELNSGRLTPEQSALCREYLKIGGRANAGVNGGDDVPLRDVVNGEIDAKKRERDILKDMRKQNKSARKANKTAKSEKKSGDEAVGVQEQSSVKSARERRFGIRLRKRNRHTGNPDTPKHKKTKEPKPDEADKTSKTSWRERIAARRARRAESKADKAASKVGGDSDAPVELNKNGNEKGGKTDKVVAGVVLAATLGGIALVGGMGGDNGKDSPKPTASTSEAAAPAGHDQDKKTAVVPNGNNGDSSNTYKPTDYAGTDATKITSGNDTDLARIASGQETWPAGTKDKFARAAIKAFGTGNRTSQQLIQAYNDLVGSNATATKLPSVPSETTTTTVGVQDNSDKTTYNYTVSPGEGWGQVFLDNGIATNPDGSLNWGDVNLTLKANQQWLLNQTDQNGNPIAYKMADGSLGVSKPGRTISRYDINYLAQHAKHAKSTPSDSGSSHPGYHAKHAK
ncbi:MAG: hypothetical protein LBM73_02945 [Candidatus Nomurabacteria bacterium]|jgi:hypothetical protein|nr:hypothetical protein [Candidatus Nomurabacteria bacterium]